jgi:tetratricopeptide (TPR) repeat protein
VLRQAKRYEEAEETYRQVVEAFRELGDREEEAWTLNSLGVLEKARQQWEAAIGWYERARGVFEELKQPANAAIVRRNIGNVLREAKRYDEAEEAYQQAIDTFRELRDFEEQSESLLALGHLYRKQNRAEETTTSYEQVTQVWDRNWDAHLALGWLQLSAEPRKTEQACQRALNGLPVHEILAHVGLATAAAVRGQVSQVQTELETARELLGVAETKYTIVKSQLEALRIVTTVLDAPTQVLQDSQAFDLEAVSFTERDLIEMAFGYLSVLAQRLMEYH